MSRLFQARIYWRKALAAFEDARDRGYADPAGFVRKTGHAAFHSEQDSRNILAQLNGQIERLHRSLADRAPEPREEA